MIEFARLSGRVWRVANTFTTSDSKFTTENIEYLDYQVLQWQKRIPESLRYDLPESEALTDSSKEPLFARVITYARANQLRNLIYRRVLYSSSRIAQHMIHAQTVVDIAKSTVVLFANLDNGTGMYRAQPVVFNHFIISALGILLLAVANAPDCFSHQCSDEYYTALRLLKQSAMESQVSMRLWRTIENLEGFGLMLGLTRPLAPDQTHMEAVIRPYQAEKSPGGNDSLGPGLHGPSQFTASGLGEDFASLFGFTTDLVDHAFLLPQDTCGSNPYGAQIGDLFSGAERDQEDATRYTAGSL